MFNDETCLLELKIDSKFGTKKQKTSNASWQRATSVTV